VGCGTATPANQLSVRNEGASAISVVDIRGGTGGAGALQISGNGTTLGTTSFDFIQNSSGAFINNRDATPLAFYVNGGVRYEIGTTGISTWSVAGTTAMTLNSTGLVIGATTGGYRLYVKAASGSVVGGAFIESGEYNQIGLVVNCTNPGQASNLFEVQKVGTAAMTLDASGNLLVGLTSGSLISGGSRLRITTGSGPAIDAQQTVTGDAVVDEWNSGTTGDNIFNRFWTETSAALRGSISYNRAGGLVAYNVTSDYRSKDIIGPVSNSGSLIDSLKVYIGKMKGATIERPMLIAHEAQEVAPYSVTGLKDEVDADGKDKYQQIDVSSFVPLLIAEIQSLRARVQTLEAR
jgi:hypothetical protein